MLTYAHLIYAFAVHVFPSQSSSFPPDLVMAPISLLLPLRSVRLSLPTVYIWALGTCRIYRAQELVGEALG